MVVCGSRSQAAAAFLVLCLAGEGAAPRLQWDEPGAQGQQSAGATGGAVSELK